MKLSNSTLEIIKNFSTINPSMLFMEGKVQKVLSPKKTIMAVAEIEEELPQDFAIHDLAQFYNLLSTFNGPDIVFKDKYCTVKNENATVRYRFCDPGLVADLKDKNLALPSTEVTFEMTKEVLNSVIKVASILRLSTLMIEGDGQTVNLSAIKPDDETSNKVQYRVGETGNEFKFYINFENLKIVDDNFDVKLSKNKLVELSAKTHKVKYWIPAEKNSTFSA